MTAGRDDHPYEPRESWLRRLLRVPLFYKILIANAAIVVAGVVGTLLAGWPLRTWSGWTALEQVLLFCGVGALVSVVVNAVILRIALAPLHRLEETIRHVRAGDLTVRASRSPLADRDLDRLTVAVNDMLNGLEYSQERLRAMDRRAVQAQEEERKRISRELHDETTQQLVALKVQLAVAQSLEDPDARRAALDGIRDGLGEAAEAVHRLALGLRPPALDELGLCAALQAHARLVTATTGVPVHVQGSELTGRPGPEAELVLYRIAQEAVANAMRHGRPSRVTVTLADESPDVVLTVEDDGCGFLPEEVERVSGRALGLFGMRERVAYFAGCVTIRSQLGAGTTVQARVPATPRRAVSEIVRKPGGT